MARRLVLMPVLPRVTVSEAENLAGSVCSARALRMDLELSQAAPRPEAERTRNSRRRMDDLLNSFEATSGEARWGRSFQTAAGAKALIILDLLDAAPSTSSGQALKG